MIKRKYVFKITLCFLIVAVSVLNKSAQSQQMDNEQTNQVDLGRDNPFARLIKKENPPVLPKVSETTIIEGYSPELSVRTVMLKFLDAKSLKQAIDNMSSGYGSIAINVKNNSLIVCDTKENLARILSEIKKADKTPQQVMIEVVILDVQLNNDTEIGINWDILSDNRYDIGYRQNFTTSRLRSTQETSTTIGDATAFNTTGMGGSFSVISGTIRNVVHLIQQKRQVEILASPSVMMVSGESASIEAVEELPYTEVIDTAAGGAAALTSTEFKRVGIQLTVNATLTDDNDIFLTVDAEQNVATGESEREVPIVDTRKANTSLLLKDGQVVIFGGLRRQEKTEKVNQIPIIGDLPIVGNLFKSTSNVVKNSELIVFLSPHIYKGEPVPEDAMSKYKQIRDRPILSLPMDAKLKGYRNQLELRVNEHTTAIEQLQQEITEYERTEGELKEYRERLEKRVNEQTGANEQLQDDIAECKQAVDELREYRYQLEQRIMEQSTTNKQLQTQVSEGKRTEGELEEYRDQLEQRVKEQTVAIEQLQLEITKRKQAERDITKKMLLDRIKILRNRKNKDATKELLSTLTSLDEILSQEMQETISSSERILADEGYRVDGNP